MGVEFGVEWVEGNKVRGKGWGGWRAMGGDHRQCVKPKEATTRPATEPPGCVSKLGSWCQNGEFLKNTQNSLKPQMPQSWKDENTLASGVELATFQP